MDRVAHGKFCIFERTKIIFVIRLAKSIIKGTFTNWLRIFVGQKFPGGSCWEA